MRDKRDVNMLWLLLLAAVAAEIPAAAGQVLTPPYFNLAEGRRITASATCGIDVTQPELYCKLVGAHADQKDNPNVNLIQGQVCDYCDPSNPELSHGPENAIDGTERWWQSPPLSRGNAYNEVNLTIDLGQVFHVAYVFIKMANSPRPGIWALERSTNHGETWEPWQYFADTPGDCVNNFGVESLEPPTKDDSVVCETEFSKVVPLEGGEIVVSLLNDRPSANNFYNSTVLQEWTKATSIRLRLIRTKTLLGHLMSVARQDPTVTRRYFYSIRDISVGGRCVCNGHADLCDITDPEDPYKLLCRCQHNTCGAQCEQCCPGFVQKKWRSATYYSVHECEPCNCFGHADECIYDEETDQLGLSLDIHGRYEGGGVCQNCQDNTEGINCNRCKPGYYRPYGRALNETDVCQSCQCDLFFSTGSCAEGSGQCECRIEFLPPLCDQCNVGYFGYPNCRPCDCHLNGTRGLVCEVGGGQCPCKSNYAGKNCDSCAEGFYNFPECLPCECNLQGAVSTTCDAVTGQCNCKTNYGSRTCSQCDNGYSSYPICQYCNCDRTGCVEEVCDKESGQCLCRKGYGGPRCDVCAPGYYGYPNCRECGCNEHGSISNTCDDTGKCQCLNNFAGLSCSQCSPGYYRFPDCLACNCDPAGAIGISCDDDGRCQCRANFDGTTCNSCRQGYYNYPACEECNCDPAGVLATFAGCGSLTTGELCQCKERVTGRVCNQCRPLYWNLLASNPLGCEDCKCHIPGTLGGINVCDGSSGQCFCKPNTASRQCDQCRDGTYNMQGDNLFGCTDCGCDVGGAVSQNCDKTSGQCACRPRISGRTCNEPLQLHYFPTVFQHQYEVEDGHTPSYTPVRYGYNQHDFANYSWRGYATFSPVQKEILLDVYVEKPSLYRVVMYYVNRAHEAVVGDIVFTPEASGDIQQSSKIRFDSTSQPQFLTVSGADSISPSHFVLNPGRWTISIVAEKPLLLDYIVLLPSAYYEATILQEHVQTPCKLGVEFGSCRHYAYPELNDFTIVRGEIGYVAADDERIPAQLYSSSELSEQLGNIGDMAYLNEDEREIQLDMFLPKSGRYVLVLLYFTPSGGHTATIHVETSSTSGRDKGHAVLYDCMFTTLCRQAVTDPSGRVAIFHFDNNFITLHLKGLEDISVLIHSVVAIPVKQWNTDFVRPRPACVRQDGKCIDATFHIIPGTTKVECEVGNENRKTNQLPSNIFDENSGLVYLDHKDAMVDIRGKVPQVGAYVFVVHYYQPRHPEFDLDVLIQNGQFYEAVLAVPFCPSASGCRALVKTKDGETKFQILENFLITLKEPNHKSVWLDYILAIPASDYKAEVLEEVPLDRAIDFITLCGSNQFHMESASSGFCRDATFSLTSEYNNGGLPCHCDFDGSISFECEKFGGQCPCKPNIIGRQCSECRTGYYGFPDCQPCNCPSTAVCHPTTGACICPPKVTGEKCETCLPNTYGFDPIIGCEECNCNPLGVQKGNLQCDILIGQCSCKPNLVGRTCDKCQAGYWAFPFCQLCDCDLRGTTEDICDQDNARCFCKENVYGPTCDQCKPGTFHLEEKSPVGCTKCFCFGKIDRCSSSTMYKIQVAETEGWSAVLLESGTANAVEQDNDIDLDGLNLQLSQDIPENTVTYFSAPNAFLGNKITSYGGQLYYIITYIQDRDISGSSIVVPDVILMGNNLTIVYENIEQPVAGEELKVELDILEQNFHHLSGGPITREQLMMVLYSLEKLYIRAQYYTDAVEARLNQVLLDTATSQYVGDAAQALSVEQCHCPPNYQGSSCEDCSPGYYRSQTGPFGGYCIPCQCNGHADTCDSLTGRCIDCKHNTTGDHCEKCLGGFHGDATIGTPYDCLICACPLPTMSNNFAVSCEFSPSGLEIKCDCKPGYYGPRCNYCAAGFYGRPEVPGEICKPCECSGNIDPSSFASCDSTTGDCLECLNNTSGAACELCSPGFFGDAISFKNCRKCSCDECGTRECHHSSGICSCMPNVIGDKCEECSPGHYGFDSCRGCVACDCGTASESSQCDLNTGQCKCRPGVTGRTCDRCLPGHWNYGVHGCRACSCNQDYSIGGSCNPETGQCECLPGVIGEKCDHCPYRWVLIPNVGCKECGTCVHVLLDDVDHLRGTLGPVLGELEGVSLSFFAYQRLNGINKTVDDLRPFVDALIYDPSSIDLLPVSLDVKSLERQSKQLDKKGNVSTELAAETSSEADKTRQDALALEKEIQDIARESLAIVDEIQELSYGIVEAAGPNVDRQIAEAERILAEIQRRDFDTPRYNAEAEDEYANDTLAKAKAFAHPLELTSERVDELKDRLKDLEDKLRELLNYTITALQQIHDTKDLNDKNKVSGAVPKIALIEELGQNSQKHLTEGRKLIEDARKLLEDAKNNFEDLGLEAERLRQSTDHLRGKVETLENELDEVKPVVREAEQHAEGLMEQANDLDNLLADTRESADNAVKAANSYSDIVDAIKEALKAAEDAVEAANQAQNMSEGMDDKAQESKDRSQELLEEAKRARARVDPDLANHLANAKKGIDLVEEMNKLTEDGLEELNRGMDRLPIHALGPVAATAVKTSNGANNKALDALGKTEWITDRLPDDIARSEQIPKDIDEANKGIKRAHNQVEKMAGVVPEISRLMDRLGNRTKVVRVLGVDVGDKIAELKRKVALAQDQANRIKLGVHFDNDVTLQIRNPDGLNQLATYNKMSLYFKTNKKNGFLAYLGNELETHKHMRRAVSDDYMSLVIDNGYVVLIMDMGHGFRRIANSRVVDDNQWHQVIVERIGKSATVIVRTEDEEDAVTTADLPGSHAVFNLDQNLSKLYIGGVPDSAMIQSTIPHKRFEGCIEDLEFEDTPIGLWNFAEGNNNNEGCVERDKLVEFKPSTGLRFDGSGYSILNRRSADKFQKRVEVVLHFRTYASNGLLFLIGKDMDFLAIELQDGKVVFHFNLGSGIAVITSPGTYNDGYWHSLQASRHKRDALLRLDGEEVGSTLAPGLLEDLAFTDEIYIGGFPGTHTFKEVTNVGFEGCIDNVQIGTTLIDLNKNKEALGIVPGCPTPVARIISFQPYSTGYVAMPNVKDVQTSAQFTLKFKTSASEGLLLYTTNTDNSNYLSLSLLDGVIVFKSNLKGEVRTASTKYNDEEWHYITATREYDEMRLDIDDYEVFQAQDSVERGHIFLDSFIYIGGVPSNVRIPPRNTASSKPLVGCIGDVTFNGLFQNFANTTDRKGGSLASCPIADPSPSPPSFLTDIPTYPTVDFDYEQQETTTKKKKSTPRPKPPPRIRTTTSIITTTTTAVPPLENQCRYSLRPAGDPDLTELSGLRFGTNNRSRLEYLIKKDDFRSSTNVSLEFKANSPDGILFYISEGQLGDFVSLYLQNGQIHMAYNLGSGSTMINSERKYDDGNWHSVVVGRNFNRAMFNVDGTIVRATSDQTSVTMVPNNPFYIGGLSDEASFSAKRHLKIVAPLNGCIRNIILPSSHERPVEHFVQPCSNKVEAGSFISVDGGYLIPYDHFRVGLDFETNLEIKPRSISGVLMSVHGKRGDYLVLQLIDGAIKFSVDNGAGAITATYYPPNRHYFCDGQWHKIQAVKAKNVVTLSVDDIFVEPGIGTAGVSSTDTYDPLYIGGVPRPSRVKGVETTDQFVGCIRDMIVNQQQAPLSNARVIGNATLNVCPTI